HASPPELSPLSLHDALPISLIGVSRRPWRGCSCGCRRSCVPMSGEALSSTHDTPSDDTAIELCVRAWACSSPRRWPAHSRQLQLDRKSTRLNSSHVAISYAV